VQDGALRGFLQLAPEGTSPRIDEVIRLVKAGILRTVSVGFVPIESEPMASGGTKFIRSELRECSLVSIPANHHAVQVSQSLGVSQETMKMVFGRNNDSTTPRRTVIVNNNLTISERIAKARRAVKALETLERAKAILKKSEARDRRDRADKARAKIKKPPPKSPEPTGRYITYRGQKIPAGWFYPGMRKNWWDPNS
jgi:hypothetical protein